MSLNLEGSFQIWEGKFVKRSVQEQRVSSRFVFQQSEIPTGYGDFCSSVKLVLCSIKSNNRCCWFEGLCSNKNLRKFEVLCPNKIFHRWWWLLGPTFEAKINLIYTTAYNPNPLHNPEFIAPVLRPRKSFPYSLPPLPSTQSFSFYSPSHGWQ